MRAAYVCTQAKRERSNFKVQRNLCAIPVVVVAKIIQKSNQYVQETDKKMADLCCLFSVCDDFMSSCFF